jgi:hypothetical protein
MVFYTIIAAEHQRACKAYQFFRSDIKLTFSVSIGVKVKNPFNDKTVRSHDFIIHTASVVIEIFNKSHNASKLIRDKNVPRSGKVERQS